MATTIAVFAGLRFPSPNTLRPHYLTPLQVFPLAAMAFGRPLPRRRLLGDRDPVRHRARRAQLRQPPVQLHARGLPQHGRAPSSSCMAAHGFHAQTIYQPATRFWAFQGIEAGIFSCSPPPSSP